jgi:hypothetical protein
VQTNKSLEQFYKKYEDNEASLPAVSEKFDNIMSHIGEIYPPEELQNTNWSRIHLFYTLFTSIAHCLYGLEGLGDSYRVSLKKKQLGQVRICLDEISVRYDEVAADMDNPDIPKDFKRFVTHSQRATTDTATRIERTKFMCKKLKDHLT